MAKQKPVKVNTPEKAVQYSPVQKAFRSNLRKIDKLKMELWFIHQATALCKETYLTAIEPLQYTYHQKQVELVKLFHQAYPRLSVRHQKYTGKVIESMSFALIEIGFKELEPIHGVYADMTFAEVEEEEDELTLSMMRQFFNAVTGNLDLSEIGKDAKTPEEYQKAVMEALGSAEFQKQFERKHGRAKTKAQQKREAKKELKQKDVLAMMNKNLRSLCRVGKRAPPRPRTG